MASGRNTQLTKQTGEFLVAAELCRRELIATTFTGNVPEFDILAINNKYKTIPIQVKTIQKGSWQLDASKFIEIEVNGNVQRVTGNTKLHYSELIYVFVKLKMLEGEDEFYILRATDLQELISKHYKKYLKEKNGMRPKNPESFHIAVLLEELKGNNYKDNWEVISGE